MAAPSSQHRPFIIDCDTGRDDALAIWAALALDLNLAGVVASYGNVTLDRVIDNSARILALAGREDIPLFAGAASPPRRHRAYEQMVLPRQANSGNGLCNLEFPKAQKTLPSPLAPEQLAAEIVRLADKTGPLDYVILGPATNFAALCETLGDDLGKYIATITMMGGKFDALWDAAPQADFNLACDPFAVRAILERGLTPRFVTLNTTWPICLPEGDVEQLHGDEKIAVAARDLMLAHIRHFAPEPLFRFHDPAVIAALTNPGRFDAANLDIICDEQNPDFGRLVRKDDGFPAALYHSDAAHGDLILQTLLAALGLSRFD